MLVEARLQFARPFRLMAGEDMTGDRYGRPEEKEKRDDRDGEENLHRQKKNTKVYWFVQLFRFFC